MVFKTILTFFCRQKPCRLPTKNIFYESLKRPAAGAAFEHLLSIWIVAQRTLLPPI
jgi:hypothetical protein